MANGTHVIYRAVLDCSPCDDSRKFCAGPAASAGCCEEALRCLHAVQAGEESYCCEDCVEEQTLGGVTFRYFTTLMLPAEWIMKYSNIFEVPQQYLASRTRSSGVCHLHLRLRTALSGRTDCHDAASTVLYT